MEFTLKNQDATSAILSVNIQEADYSALVEKQLKNIRQKANFPGFRPGMVPMGLVKKQYGVAVKAEEINKLLQTKIFEYIRENKIDMLGGSEEAVPGPSVFPSREPGVSGDFWGSQKGCQDRFALQGGTGDFP